MRVSRAHYDVFTSLVLFQQQSEIPEYSIYNDMKQGKTCKKPENPGEAK